MSPRRAGFARFIRCGLACALLVCGGGCVETGPGKAELSLRVAGTEAASIDARKGFSVDLQSAQLAFGPVYLCASDVAGDLCDVSRAEWLGSVVVDALDPTPQEVGTMHALQGEVRSMMYDLGLGFPITQDVPRPTEAGELLDGYSVWLEGRATRDDVTLPFEARVQVAANTPGRSAASGQLHSHTITPRDDALVLTFDPTRWVSDIDFEALAADASDDDGVELQPDTQAYRAVVNGLTATARPGVEWD